MNYPSGTFGYERQRIEREVDAFLNLISDVMERLSDAQRRICLGADECQPPRSASAPHQDAATELTAADAQRIVEIASEVAVQVVATTLRGRASGEST